MPRLKRLAAGTAAAGLLLASPPAILAQWQSAGTLPVPTHSYSFLAATPSGDLIACTFNTAGVNTGARQIPALMIRNPASPTPEVTEICRVGFDGQRGYSGVACDESGSFYISADTGQAATSYVQKYTPQGQPDPAFGQGGLVKPNRRSLGIDVIGEYLLVAVDWGEVYVYRSKTGEVVGRVPKAVGAAPGPVHVRDIAIEPATLTIFGVAAGSVVAWSGGSPWEPHKYSFSILTPQAGEVRSGEGLSIDPLRKAAVVTPVRGHTLLEVQSAQNILRTTVSSADPNAHLADSVVSFDGQSLFVSDIIGGQIHVLKRSADAALADRATPFIRLTAAAATPVVTPAPSAPAPQVTWYRSYADIVEAARRRGYPMVVYFRKAGFARCEEFEKNVLVTNDFNGRAQTFYCVFEDVDRNRLMAYRFGVIKIPYLVILGAKGETMAEFTGNIDPNVLFAAMDKLR